jgi:hypothetical protein
VTESYRGEVDDKTFEKGLVEAASAKEKSKNSEVIGDIPIPSGVLAVHLAYAPMPPVPELLERLPFFRTPAQGGHYTLFIPIDAESVQLTWDETRDKSEWIEGPWGTLTECLFIEANSRRE